MCLCVCVYTLISHYHLLYSPPYMVYILYIVFVCIDVYMHDCRTIIIIQVLAAGFFLGCIFLCTLYSYCIGRATKLSLVRDG